MMLVHVYHYIIMDALYKHFFHLPFTMEFKGLSVPTLNVGIPTTPTESGWYAWRTSGCGDLPDTLFLVVVGSTSTMPVFRKVTSSGAEQVVESVALCRTGGKARVRFTPTGIGIVRFAPTVTAILEHEFRHASRLDVLAFTVAVVDALLNLGGILFESCGDIPAARVISLTGMRNGIGVQVFSTLSVPIRDGHANNEMAGFVGIVGITTGAIDLRDVKVNAFGLRGAILQRSGLDMRQEDASDEGQETGVELHCFKVLWLKGVCVALLSCTSRSVCKRKNVKKCGVVVEDRFVCTKGPFAPALGRNDSCWLAM